MYKTTPRRNPKRQPNKPTTMPNTQFNQVINQLNNLNKEVTLTQGFERDQCFCWHNSYLLFSFTIKKSGIDVLNSKLINDSNYMNVKQLKQRCKENNLKGYSKLKRAELLKLLMTI